MLNEAETKLEQQKAELKSRRAAEMKDKTSQSSSRDKYRSPERETKRDSDHIRMNRDKFNDKYHRDRRRNRSPISDSHSDSTDSGSNDSYKRYRKHSGRSRNFNDRDRDKITSRRHESREESRRDSHRGRDYYSERYSDRERQSRSKLSERFKKPRNDSSDSDEKKSLERRLPSSKTKTMTTSSGASQQPAWKKKGFVKPQDNNDSDEGTKRRFLKPGEISSESEKCQNTVKKERLRSDVNEETMKRKKDSSSGTFV